ncbi:MAG TPA: alkaline phosphatase family protein [Terriglobia bacterium]|nr:alkaline phosphatase family protein [Terriglobia bacterium]
MISCGGGGGQPGTSQAEAPPPPPSRKVEHVVVIVQENRTPDNLFHGLPNADIANSGVNSSGQTIPLTPVVLAGQYDLGHTHRDFESMYDGGRMDGADKIKAICTAKNAVNCAAPHPQFRYVEPSEVEPYFQLAEKYTFADRMFQTNQGPSFPAHQFIISGTSAPTADSDLFAAENPTGPLALKNPLTDTGCAAPPRETVALIDPDGDESAKQYPCFEHPTLMDLLDNQDISWRYYTPLAGSIWTAPNAIRHLGTGFEWANVILNQKQVLVDIATGHLSQVSWVIPSGQASDHPRINTGLGPSWVASVVNAIGSSPYWQHTAIFITWDDWGGWYDHVPPPIYDSYEYGFRVPLIVVSPYARTNYVSHAVHDFGSILRFIENNYDLTSLGYADSRADDLSDCFDFTRTPAQFEAVPAEHDAQFFLNDTSPPQPPDDD